MTNPYQEPQPEVLTFVEAVRAIAERTAFRTEAERDSVLAACDKAAETVAAEPEPEPEPEPDAEVKAAGPTGNGDADLKAAARATRTK